ncbi:MAG: ABC transporter permease [Anaerolineae bacterium]|nr:ABC transporter permease [Anaerolineae bacterium]NUQ05056.1 ABC transporter permease [Anaerolineae bacterium]
MFGGFGENVRVALTGLGANKLRSSLTMLGITIGVAAVIVLVSLGQAVETFVRGQFLGLGTNLILIFPAEDSRGATIRLTLDEVEALDDPLRVPDALYVMPQLNLTRVAAFNGREAQGRVRGVTDQFPTMRSRAVAAGRFFDRTEVDGLARVAVIGTTVVDRLFPETYPIGQTFRLGDVSFRVIGVMENASSPNPFAGDENDLIFVPITTAGTRLSGERDLRGDRPITSVLVQARDEDSIAIAAAQIRQTLREERGISFRDEDTFEIFTQDDLLESLGQITGLLTIFLAIIAGISLLVGGIGIMNIMLVTVTERTREIGLRKAVGAQKNDILMQFLIEAMVLSLLGGGIGVGIALSGALLVSSLSTELAVRVQPESILVATAISIGIGIFFGIYPANRAASLNPIDALRYE